MVVVGEGRMMRQLGVGQSGERLGSATDVCGTTTKESGFVSVSEGSTQSE